MFRHILPILLLLAAVSTCIRIGTIRGEKERLSWKLVTSPPLANFDTKRLNIMTFGHRGLYDDFATIWSVQFLADRDLLKKASAEEVFMAIQSVTKHQPKVESLYMLSCFVLALDFKRDDFCEKISVDGLKALPNSWRIPMTQGFIATILQKDDVKAAAFYQMAASQPESPEYVGRIAKKLAVRGFANGQDLNETTELLREVPGGSKVIEILRQHLQNVETPPRPGDHP